MPSPKILLPIRLLCIFLVLAAAGALPDRAAAQLFCTEPVLPYCVDQYSDFDSTMQMDRCEEDLKAQKKKLADYEECTMNKIKDLREELNEAMKKLEEVRKNFQGTSG